MINKVIKFELKYVQRSSRRRKIKGSWNLKSFSAWGVAPGSLAH